MDELKPCPFCGGVAKLRHFKREKCYRVACEDIDCDCVAESGYHATEAQAIEAWNRRTPVITKVETNFYDKEETFPDCTVQVLTNTATGETSVGWWRNA